MTDRNACASSFGAYGDPNLYERLHHRSIGASSTWHRRVNLLATWRWSDRADGFAGGREVGELLVVGLEELRALGRTLADAASTMNGISVTATVTMPGSPIAADSEQSTRSTAEAYARIALNVSEMSATCEWSATSYEDVDEAFSSQLLRYEAGAPH